MSERRAAFVAEVKERVPMLSDARVDELARLFDKHAAAPCALKHVVLQNGNPYLAGVGGDNFTLRDLAALLAPEPGYDDVIHEREPGEKDLVVKVRLRYRYADAMLVERSR